jgi:ABC-type transport system substrate-binding protein
MKKALTCLLFLLIACSFVFANGASEASAASGGYKDTITFAQGADVTSFDPHIGKETPAVAVTNHIYDTLVDIDSVSGEVVPQIAERWEQISDVSYRFFIRKGLKFHNGEDLTADDVKFSLDRAIASAAVSYIVDFIKDVKIEDDYTVVVTTKAPYAPALRNLAVPFAAIVPKDYVEANPDILKTKPVGSGPYKFVSWAQSDSCKLEAFDDYYAGAPADAIIAPAVFGYYSPGQYGYNPEKAKKLLAEAGYPNGFSCSLWVNNNQTRVEMCQAIQEMLREVGITCKIEVMEFGAFISRSTSGEHDMAYFGWVTSTKDADYTYYSLEHSSQQGAAGNRTFIADPEVDRLIELARTNTDTDTRREAYKDLAILLKDIANNAPIIYTAITAGSSNKVENFALDPIGYHKLEGVTVHN